MILIRLLPSWKLKGLFNKQAISLFMKKSTADFNCAVINTSIFLQGYSYVAPSILFSENQITQDFLMPSTINQPKNAHVSLASQFKVSLKPFLILLTPIIQCHNELKIQCSKYSTLLIDIS